MGTESHIYRRKSERGFTLLELLITIAVAAILMGIAIPSYRGVLQRNAMAANVNDLVGDLNYARSEAVTRGTSIVVCKSKDQKSCISGGDWSQGWIVYAPAPGTDTLASDDERLRVRAPLDGGVTIFGNNNLEKKASFDANGFTSDFGTFTAKADQAGRDTEIVIARTGRIRTQKTSGDDS